MKLLLMILLQMLFLHSFAMNFVCPAFCIAPCFTSFLRMLPFLPSNAHRPVTPSCGGFVPKATTLKMTERGYNKLRIVVKRVKREIADSMSV